MFGQMLGTADAISTDRQTMALLYSAELDSNSE